MRPWVWSYSIWRGKKCWDSLNKGSVYGRLGIYTKQNVIQPNAYDGIMWNNTDTGISFSRLSQVEKSKGCIFLTQMWRLRKVDFIDQSRIVSSIGKEVGWGGLDNGYQICLCFVWVWVLGVVYLFLFVCFVLFSTWGFSVYSWKCVKIQPTVASVDGSSAVQGALTLLSQ